MSNVSYAPSPQELMALYERMLLIRRMEEQIRADAAAGKLAGAVHLYIGQEAVAVGVCAHLKDTDWITSTHRGHGHFLAKGGDQKAMMAEIHAKRTGVCQGMGGSMHVADFSKGMLGANGIVGGGLAIATGAALAAQLDKSDRVAVTFFGDGAAHQGVLMECLNVSSLWRLPLVFVCEHNGFSEFMPAASVMSGEIVDLARAFKMPCHVVDGNDALAVWQAGGEAIARARRGEGPSFIEAHTYRIEGHVESEKLMLEYLGGKYREQSEIEAWLKKDPVERLKSHLLAGHVATEVQVESIAARVAGQVAQAMQFAGDSEPANPELPLELMFVDQRA